MLNNKGLVVSSVLYTLLIAFLLFLGVTLAQFSSSTKLISNSTKDLVNGYEFKGEMVYETYSQEVFSDFDGTFSFNYNTYGASGPVCGTPGHYQWNQKLKKNEYGQVTSKFGDTADDSDTLVRIHSRYGTTFWPRDFKDEKALELKSLTNNLQISKCEKTIGSGTIWCDRETVINAIEGGDEIKMTIKDILTGKETTVTVYKTC